MTQTQQAETGPLGSIAVYSCHFGAHEPLNANAMAAAAGADRFLFTDQPEAAPDGVRPMAVDDPDLSPKDRSRLPKLRPHLFFPDHDWVVYVDNRASLTCDPVRLIEVAAGWDAKPGRILFRHTERACPYEELAECRRLRFMSEDEADRAEAALKEAGLPRASGLYANTLMIQRMGDPATDAMNEDWWNLHRTLCGRDQVTLPLAAARAGLSLSLAKAPNSAFIDWPVFTDRERRSFQTGEGALGWARERARRFLTKPGRFGRSQKY